MVCSVSVSEARCSNAYATKVIGTRKLPTRMTVGTRLEFSVTNVTSTLASQRKTPPKKILTQARRWWGIRAVACPIPGNVARGPFAYPPTLDHHGGASQPRVCDGGAVTLVLPTPAGPGCSATT